MAVVNESLKIETVPIADLTPHPKNPRIHPDSALNKLVKSFLEFGWTTPVLVDADGRILAGHARCKAAAQAGIKEVPVIRLPLSGAKADAYVIADNRTQEETQWDKAVLIELMEDLTESGYDLAETGFDAEELDKLIGAINEPEIPPEDNTANADIVMVSFKMSREVFEERRVDFDQFAETIGLVPFVQGF